VAGYKIGNPHTSSKTKSQLKRGAMKKPVVSAFRRTLIKSEITFGRPDWTIFGPFYSGYQAFILIYSTFIIEVHDAFKQQ